MVGADPTRTGVEALFGIAVVRRRNRRGRPRRQGPGAAPQVADTGSLVPGSRGEVESNRSPGGASTAGRGKADELVSGRSHDHQRATLVTATGQLHGRLRAVSRIRCHGDPTFVSDGRIEHGCRHPTHLLECPHWASLPPRRSTRTNHHAPAATDTGYRCRSGRSELLPLDSTTRCWWSRTDQKSVV